ncbi:MAG: SDR family NAD(P)-dependent oxidoreductase [Alphaproteobacteria bacterium]|nr:SDR family NAD(P)-dependent oxidoreductase [Alphaproteobacteria bacterium]
MQNPRSILITGASSGIGAALAEAYAAPGVQLFLCARNADRLAEVAARCGARGARVTTACIDVTDSAAMEDWILKVNYDAPLELVIANAGISAGTAGGTESEKQARAIFAANLDGVLNTVLPIIPYMQTRRHGQIAIMSSLAGLRGMPGAPAYSASKAAVLAYGEGLRGWLRNDNVEVSVICPGFIRTPMTDVNRFPMPFIMDAAKAARIIRRGLARNKARIAFPFPMYAMLWLLRALPVALTDRLLAMMPEKA